MITKKQTFSVHNKYLSQLTPQPVNSLAVLPGGHNICQANLMS